MASEGPNSPAGVAQVTPGLVWVNPSNLLVDDGNQAQVFATEDADPPPDIVKDIKVRLIVGGVEKGDDKATNAAIDRTVGYESYGGSSDDWTAAPTVAEVNSTGFDFGVVMKYEFFNASAEQTRGIEVTNFGFSIPAGSTIDGILVEVDQIDASGTDDLILVRHIQMTVFYTTASFQPAWASRVNVLIGGGITDDGQGG